MTSEDNRLERSGSLEAVCRSIAQVLDDARASAYRAVNNAMVQAYWNTGRIIVEEEQQGKVRADYGAALIPALSKRLTAEFGKGFTESNLKYMRLFYSAFPNRHALRDELNWTHYRLLLKVEKEEARQFYLTEAVRSNWSTRELERSIALRIISARRRAIAIVAALCIAGMLPAAAAPISREVSVKAFGALGNGTHDDTPAIQAAIDAIARRGGGIVRIPRGTYLLSSYHPSPHPWYFYNLRAGSNITLQGEAGAKLLQGPGGRASMTAIPGATEVMTSVLVFGSPNYVINTYQDKRYNGGFYPARATRAGNRSVTLASRSYAAKFHAGDYVAIYATDPTNKDVVPSESTQVTAVSASGTLSLRYPLARAFASPVIANVTSLATVNVGISGLIVQGTVPLNINEVYGCTVTDNTFISDMSIGAGYICSLIMNDIRGMRFARNTVTSVGPYYVNQELPQRNSQDIVIEANTFNARTIGFGEYGAHWRITGNRMSVHPETPKPGVGVSFGGYDVLFKGNVIQGSTAELPLIADWIGLREYGAYVGKIRIIDNVIDCRTAGGNCLNIAGPDTEVRGNYFSVTGNTGEVILVEGSMPQAIRIEDNLIWVQDGMGIVLNSPGEDRSVVSHNTITGAGLMGIYVTSPAAPNPGSHVITGNTVTGFHTPISIDMAKHPGAVVRSDIAAPTAR